MRLPEPGQLFEHKYEIREVLGQGGFAMVFRATDVELARDVAIKVLAPRDGEYPTGLEARFMREARVIAGLTDAHTIKLFEFGQSADGLLYMVFQYVWGLDLATVLRRRGPLTGDVVAHVTRQVAQALSEAHAAGVLHRDIKPANVLVHEYMDDEYAVKLLDFGIAKVDRPAAGGLTKTGVLLGTPRYMSPEQIYGEPLAPASDIYSLGLVAYEMLVGEPAMNGTREEILRQQVSDEPIRVPAHRGWPTLRSVFERMLMREPADRFQEAADVVRALDFASRYPDISSSGPMVPNPPEVTPAPQYWSSQDEPVSTPTGTSTGAAHPRKRMGPVVLISSIVLAVSVAALAVQLSRQAERPAAPRTDALPEALLVAPSERPGLSDSPDSSTSRAATTDVGADDANPGEPALPGGCGRRHEWQAEAFLSAGSRAVRVYVPKTYDPAKRYSLILALQPRNWETKQYVRRAGLDELAFDLADVIVLGVPPENRLQPWVDRSDVDVLRAAVETAAGELCVDRDRVFAVGTADGGRMARELACEMRLAGIATSGDGEHSGAHSCEPDPPVPMLWILGRDDRFVPMHGGPGCAGGDYLSAEQHDLLWRVRNDCTDEVRTFHDEGETECRVWTCRAAPYGACRAEGGHYLKDTKWDMWDPAGCDSEPLGLRIGPVAWKFFEGRGSGD